MNKLEWNEWQDKSIKGEVPDDNNPIFIFAMTDNQLLLDAINGKTNLVELAKRELESRRINLKTGRAE